MKNSGTFLSVAFVHVAILVGSVLLGVAFHDTNPKFEEKPSQVKSIAREVSVDAINADAVDRAVEKFRNLKSQASEREILQRQEIDDLKRESLVRNKSIAAKKQELSELSRRIEKQKMRLEELRKKKIADLKRKKRLAEEKHAREVAKEAKKKAAARKQKLIEAKKKQEEAEKKRLEEVERKRREEVRIARLREADNQRRIQAEAAARLVEKKRKDRGEYEDEIYERMFSAWSLPYVRSNVKCSVRLDVAKDGTITGYDFITPCPEMYKSSIVTAINNVGQFDIKEQSTYRSKEVVNFLDNLSNQSVG
ncbi:hypothetical protein [Photobacterium damselae]|uniref:hypothetical protein n=1 Tax=Photobacterium damselae TaxID=38293 RepID=UPI001F298410|nr:hypothetical protein [Photobacterium damselae]UKA04588.1 hypothetical protein IHC89_23505 [Photobacterium damselae subsp. damselae]